MRAIKKVRRRPISLKQIEEDTTRAEANERSIVHPILDIKDMRQPYHLMDATTKKQCNIIAKKYKKIDEKFLRERIKPRIVIFMEDGTSIK